MKHIPHLYLPSPWAGSHIRVSKDQEHHLSKVLRIDIDQELSYTDGVGTVGKGTWSPGVVARGEELSVGRPSRLVMAVAPPSNKDRVRFVVEKLAELGVEQLVWLRTTFGTGRLPPPEKQMAWAISALEQSRGGWLMGLGGEFVTWSDLEEPVLVCQPAGSAVIEVLAPRTVVVGPEGGFDPDEVPSDFESVALGETILRVETAAVVAATKFLD